MKPTLLILAAGMGNRYGGLKQIDPMGPSGETLMEYGIYDAINAGFKKAVFLFRDNIVSAFEDNYQKLVDHIEVEYVFQDINPVVTVGTEKLSYTPRKKPWGTAHAILSAASAINEPFSVINADDFYGPSGYQEMSDFLNQVDANKQQYAVVGYPIEKTLSPHGTVSRAVLELNGQQNLSKVVERTQIAMSDNKIQYCQDHKNITIPGGTLVSTNFWGFTPAIFHELQQQFSEFVARQGDNPKSEFFIPYAVNNLVESEAASVNVLTCQDNWMGVTYKEDKATVMGTINSYIDQGIYPKSLWN
jgi:UTP-glucose-1-phosphate uridylyltransferase